MITGSSEGVTDCGTHTHTAYLEMVDLIHPSQIMYGPAQIQIFEIIDTAPSV